MNYNKSNPIAKELEHQNLEHSENQKSKGSYKRQKGI